MFSVSVFDSSGSPVTYTRGEKGSFASKARRHAANGAQASRHTHTHTRPHQAIHSPANGRERARALQCTRPSLSSRPLTCHRRADANLQPVRDGVALVAEPVGGDHGVEHEREADGAVCDARGGMLAVSPTMRRQMGQTADSESHLCAELESVH
eukprot:1515402-Prymnesium_polylepis.1